MGWSASRQGKWKSNISGRMLTSNELDAEKRQHEIDQRQSDSRAENSRKIEDLEKKLAAQKAAPAPQPKAAPPKPKPGPQQIEPVKASPEISAAQKVVNSYQDGLKNKKSPWEQAQSNVSDSSQFGNFNPGGDSSDSPTSGSDQVNQMKQDSQTFADKYKLDLIKSGATNNGFS